MASAVIQGLTDRAQKYFVLVGDIGDSDLDNVLELLQRQIEELHVPGVEGLAMDLELMCRVQRLDQPVVGFVCKLEIHICLSITGRSVQKVGKAAREQNLSKNEQNRFGEQRMVELSIKTEHPSCYKLRSTVIDRREIDIGNWIGGLIKNRSRPNRDCEVADQIKIFNSTINRKPAENRLIRLETYISDDKRLPVGGCSEM